MAQNFARRLIISTFKTCNLSFCLIPLLLLLSPITVSADLIEDDSMPAGKASSQDMCPTEPKLVPVANEIGSVGLMKNLAEHPESIRAVAGRLLKSAVENTEFLAPSACTGACSSKVKAEVVYEVQPMVFLANEKQQQICLDLEKSTQANPMRFGPKSFPDVEALHQWINDFTRGKGDDGEKLYNDCGANCSPRYQFFISKDGEALEVRSDVLCGLARDKDEENYQVATSIRQTCLTK